MLAGYGIRGAEAVHAVRYLRSLLHGFTSLEAAGGFGMPTDLERSYRRIIGALLVNLHDWGRRKAQPLPSWTTRAAPETRRSGGTKG